MEYAAMRSWFAVLAALALTAAGLWAAGEEEESAAAVEKEIVLDPSTGKMVTAPVYGGILHYPISWLPADTDPDPSVHWSAVVLISGVLERLGVPDWKIDRITAALTTPNSVQEFLLTGLTAVNWETPDNTTIVIRLCSSVYWHDKPPMNGRGFNAKDVEYTFHRVYGHGSGFLEPTDNRDISLERVLESVTATDDRTVVFKLRKPSLDALKTILDDPAHFIVPPEVIEQHGDLKDWRNVVGTGPYELTDVVEKDYISWTKNPNYWRYDEKYPEEYRLPYTDELRALFMPESGTRLAALRSGKLDILGYGGFSQITSIDQVENLKRTHSDIQLWPWAWRSENAYALNTTEPPFDDIRVRRAMQMALDHEKISDTYFKGRGFWDPRGIVDIPRYSVPFEEWPDEMKQYYTYDTDGAEQLLDEAGYPRGPDGIRFKTEVLLDQEVDIHYRELTTAFFAEIGVEVELQLVGSNEFLRRVGEHDYSMASARSGYSDDAIYALSLLRQPGWPGIHDSEYGKLYDAAQNAATFEERQTRVQELNMYVTAQHWLLWGTKAPIFNINHPWVKGYNGESSLGTLDWNAMLARLWIDQDLKQEMGY